MITDNDKKILDAFYEPVPMGPNDNAVLRKVLNAVKAAEPELFRLRDENEQLRKERDALRKALKPLANTDCRETGTQSLYWWVLR